MDCIVHGIAKSRTQLSDFHFHFHPLGVVGQPGVMAEGRPSYFLGNLGIAVFMES